MRRLLMLFILGSGCGDSLPERPEKETGLGLEEPMVVEGAPLLPTMGGALHPSLTLYSGDTAALLNPNVCASCHEDVVATWSRSAHARASFDNPWYRAVVDAFREERGFEESRFCSGCHDPALVSTGGADQAISPQDPRAHAGITCLVCHSTVRTTADGNGSMVVDIRDPLLPDPANPSQVAAHRERMRPEPLETPELCGSCHRSFMGQSIGVPHHVGGVDDIGAWRTSVYAGSHGRRIDEPVEEATCSGCHMPPVDATRGDVAATDGQILAHSVRGAHTPIENAEETRSMLTRAATIDVPRARTAEGWEPIETFAERRTVRGDLAFDVVIRNVGVGHRFPGGTRDLQDTWIELTIRDAGGRVVAEAGTNHATDDDPSAFVLRATVLDSEGRPERRHRVHRFHAPVFDRSIPPRDALAARYEVTLEGPARGPFQIEARLRHRRHSRDFQAFVCEAHRTPRGRAFDRASRELGREPVDPCSPEPITEIAEWIVGTSERTTWRRLHDLALGLSHSVQERLDEARPVLRDGRAAAETPFQRAMLDLIEGRIAARQGRLDEALHFADAAERGAPDHAAAIARVRGEAYAQVWQWESAAEAFAEVAEGAPRDAASWRDLARARGSTGDDEGAFRASLRGLTLRPRDADLLRSQHLALDRLDAGTPEVREAFLMHRTVDEGPTLLRRCQRSVEGCDRDRQPVPTIQMRTR